MINRLAIYGAIRSLPEHAAWIESLRSDFGSEPDMQSVLAALDERGCIPMNVAAAPTETFNMKDFIPEKWGTEVKEHRISARAILNPEKEAPFTHLALFAGSFEKETRWPLYFGRHVIKQQFAICGWSPEKQHVYFHCVGCVTNIVNWITSMQGEWKEAGLPPPVKEPTNVAPARLQ